MASQPLNFIAVGVYTKGDEPGTLEADWARSDRVSIEHDNGVVCKGKATGGPVDGFAGCYSIIYTDAQGNAGEPYKLTITPAGQTYLLTWEKNGHEPSKHYTGIGIVIDDKLVLGWA